MGASQCLESWMNIRSSVDVPAYGRSPSMQQRPETDRGLSERHNDEGGSDMIPGKGRKTKSEGGAGGWIKSENMRHEQVNTIVLYTIVGRRSRQNNMERNGTGILAGQGRR